MSSRNSWEKIFLTSRTRYNQELTEGTRAANHQRSVETDQFSQRMFFLALRVKRPTLTTQIH